MSLRDGARTPQQAIAATEQTARRKLNEIKLALELEKRWTRQQILEAYVNAAYFGHRAYDIHAAAQVFFGDPRPARPGRGGDPGRAGQGAVGVRPHPQEPHRP